jgi:TrmH family RNA methyltransferase
MRLLSIARDLARRKARERDGRFVAEGIRAVEELLTSPLAIEGIVCGPQLVDTPRGAKLRAAIDRQELLVADVSEREFAGAASTESPQGVLAIAAVPERALADLLVRDQLTILVLDAVQDPGNVGTMIRTAHALGTDATLALPGTVDVWNAKVVRSAMGSLFHHHVAPVSLADLAELASSGQLTCWALDPRGRPIDTIERPRRLALIAGNEGAGVTPSVGVHVHDRVALRMRGDAESLNVAVATGIALYQVQLS